jgi:hypothetical protein
MTNEGISVDQNLAEPQRTEHLRRQALFLAQRVLNGWNAKTPLTIDFTLEADDSAKAIVLLCKSNLEAKP